MDSRGRLSPHGHCSALTIDYGPRMGEQIGRAAAGRSHVFPTPAASVLTPEQIAEQQKRNGLELSRQRILQQLEMASNPQHRSMLEAALAELDAQLKATRAMIVERRAPRPSQLEAAPPRIKPVTITFVKKFWENPADSNATAVSRQAPVPDSLQIGSVTISPATVLAPMAGVTDTVFRRFIRNLGGCGLIMTEFTSADGVLRAKDQKAKRYLHFYEDEHPISAQLFGSDPQVMADAARIVEDLGFDLVDLNLGCPGKKSCEVQRRIGPVARPAAYSRNFRSGACGGENPVYREVPCRME